MSYSGNRYCNRDTYILSRKRVMAMAHDQPDARPAWQVTYLDFTAIIHDSELIEKAQAGNISAQCSVVGTLSRLSRNHLVDLHGKPDPAAPFRKGLTIKRVA